MRLLLLNLFCFHGEYNFTSTILLIMHIQDLAGVTHDDIDPSVFSINN